MYMTAPGHRTNHINRNYNLSQMLCSHLHQAVAATLCGFTLRMPSQRSIARYHTQRAIAANAPRALKLTAP